MSHEDIYCSNNFQCSFYLFSNFVVVCISKGSCLSISASSFSVIVVGGGVGIAVGKSKLTIDNFFKS